MYREQKDAAGVLPAGPVDPDEMLMRQTPNGAMAPGERFEDASFEGAGFDSAGFDSASRLEDPDAPLSPASGTGWPPTGLPVALWPAEMLREALTGGPGVGLARLVAEAADVEGQLDAGPDSAGSTSGVDAHAGQGALADLPDDVLVEMLGACGRLQSWAAGIQARVVAERAARETNPLARAWSRPGSTERAPPPPGHVSAGRCRSTTGACWRRHRRRPRRRRSRRAATRSAVRPRSGAAGGTGVATGTPR
jgi:hypothetical protein